MKKISLMLMKRDGLSWEEAKSLVIETRLMIMRAVQAGDYDEAENILLDELGLEPDYILDFI